jgi:hypothetical protein
MDKPKIEKLADHLVEEIIRDLKHEKRIRELTAVTPVSQTAKNCLVQFPKTVRIR